MDASDEFGRKEEEILLKVFGTLGRTAFNKLSKSDQQKTYEQLQLLNAKYPDDPFIVFVCDKKKDARELETKLTGLGLNDVVVNGKYIYLHRSDLETAAPVLKEYRAKVVDIDKKSAAECQKNLDSKTVYKLPIEEQTISHGEAKLEDGTIVKDEDHYSQKTMGIKLEYELQINEFAATLDEKNDGIYIVLPNKDTDTDAYTEALAKITEIKAAVYADPNKYGRGLPFYYPGLPEPEITEPELEEPKVEFAQDKRQTLLSSLIKTTENKIAETRARVRSELEKAGIKTYDDKETGSFFITVQDEEQAQNILDAMGIKPNEIGMSVKHPTVPASKKPVTVKDKSTVLDKLLSQARKDAKDLANIGRSAAKTINRATKQEK